MRFMRWIDSHLDLAYLVVSGHDVRIEPSDPSARCVSLPALRAADVQAACGTIFTEPGVFGEGHPHGYPASDDVDAAEAVGRRQLAVYQQLAAEGLISIVRTAGDLANDSSAGPLKIVLLMEGADPIRTPEQVQEWFGAGLRIVGMTWAVGTRYAGGNAGGGPLTPRGIELVKALDAVGIIHDVSHLSDEAFEGLLANAAGRIMASHSNARALQEPRQRHLRDDQIRAIGERGGVIGLNLYSPFLAVGRRATIADAVLHIEHITRVMGHRRGIGLGSDMDGGFQPKDLPEDLDHPAKLTRLSEALDEAGWTDQEIEGFAHANWARFFAEALPKG